MSNSRTLIPSPARSQGAPRTPRRYVTPRKTRSVCSPARSTTSGRLSTLIQEHREQDISSFMLSPIVRRSLLPDDTDIDVPGRKSWWKNLNDQSRDVTEVLKENIIEPHNIMDELNIEVLSQETKKRYTLDLPDSSDCESIQSIVIPHKRLFDQKENRPQKQFDDFGNSRTYTVFESNADHEKPTTTRTKELFQSKPTAKLAFPAALLDVSANTTVGNKTVAPAVKPRTGLRNMFGTQQATKRKNMFAKFIESTTDYSSEEEIVDVSKVQRKFFDLPKPGPQRRTSARSSSSKLRDQSPTSNDMADSFADWDHLPSSTMVDNQLEAAGGNKTKRSRLSKLSEASSPLTSNGSKSGNKSKHLNKSLKNKSQINNKSLEKIVDIPQNTTLTLKSKESREMNNIKTQNIQNTENKVEKPIDISLKNNDHKSLLNEENAVPENNEMDIDEKQTEEQEFRDTAEKNKNTIKPTVNESLDKSSKKNYSSAISSKNNVIDLAMEKLDEIINHDVDMDVLIPQDESINKLEKENLECQYDNVSGIRNKENDSQLNYLKINEDNNFSPKENKFEECIAKNIEMDKTIDKLQTENKQNNRNNVETVAPNKISKSRIQNESVNSNDAKKHSQNIEVMQNTMVNNEHLGENKNQTNEIEQDDIQNIQNKSRNECNDSQEIRENNESQEEITLYEENIIEEENRTVIDNQEIENENGYQEAEKNDSVTEEQENDDNESEVEEQEVDDNESEIQEQIIDESETKEQDENESQIEEEIVDENEVANEDQDNEDNNQEDASEVDEQIMTPEASNQSIEAMVDSEPENDHASEQSENEEVNESEPESDNEEELINDSDNEQINESEPESDNEEELINDSDNEQINESERQSEAEHVNESDQNDEDVLDNTFTPDISHDTTGRNRKKPDNVSIEAVVFRPTKELEHSFVGRARNTTVKQSKSLINPRIEPEKIQENNSKGSLSMSEGRNSSAEGSGWDSHKITRKTLRQTFGKDFTPRKSLRALVMEKSAKRHTLAKGSKDITTGKIPLANSTELGESSMGHDYEMQEESVESEHEVSIRTRKAALEECLKKIKRENDEKRAKMAEAVKKLLEQAPQEHTFKVPGRPTFQRRNQAKVSTNKKLKLSVPLEDLPADFQQDIKYKPPKRYAPRKAAWLTKRFYKYVESKLKPKYDYKARVRAEKFAQTLYNFVQANRRRNIALQDHVDELKHEMARLNIVNTHFEFYNFFWDFMPREVRLKVIPDLTNKIPQPRNGIFSDIIVFD